MEVVALLLLLGYDTTNESKFRAGKGPRKEGTIGHGGISVLDLKAAAHGSRGLYNRY